MAANKTIKKAVCDVCGAQVDTWQVGRKHGYKEGDCGGLYVERDIPKDVITGEFTYERSYGNRVYLRHTETGREVNVFTVDLLKVLAGRPIGTLTLTESKRGSQSCWKAEEANVECTQ
ncbi:hypothetical protein [Paenibacillus agricola]|uniref:Uncharacterized protein n=1 Tax=Paenibacillus agricola TaxID=2716264 RepID=A0ABX0J6E0_9BACL|nr:hypothetical protein [Paenibacillus agricola]NHN31188.1 hypothetical protein [Paenibacillus agricola]